MIISIKLIFYVRMVLVIPLLLLIFLCLTQVLVRSRILSREDDVDQPINTIKDLLHFPIDPITRSKIKALKEAMNGLVTKVLAKADFGDPLEHQD